MSKPECPHTPTLGSVSDAAASFPVCKAIASGLACDIVAIVGLKFMFKRKRPPFRGAQPPNPRPWSVALFGPNLKPQPPKSYALVRGFAYTMYLGLLSPVRRGFRIFGGRAQPHGTTVYDGLWYSDTLFLAFSSVTRLRLVPQRSTPRAGLFGVSLCVQWPVP